MKFDAKFAVPVVVLITALVAGSCALPRQSQQKQFLVQKLVTDVETAIQAVTAYYDNKKNPIRFAESTINVNTKYVKTTEGGITAVISVSGSDVRTNADSLVIKLGALSVSLRESEGKAWEGFSQDTKNAIADEKLECADPEDEVVTVSTEDQPDETVRTVPEQLALLAISGANGYVCAVRNGALLNLNELTISVGFNVVQTTTGGLEIEFSPITLGGKSSGSYTHDHSIIMKFTGI